VAGGGCQAAHAAEGASADEGPRRPGVQCRNWPDHGERHVARDEPCRRHGLLHGLARAAHGVAQHRGALRGKGLDPVGDDVGPAEHDGVRDASVQDQQQRAKELVEQRVVIRQDGSADEAHDPADVLARAVAVH